MVTRIILFRGTEFTLPSDWRAKLQPSLENIDPLNGAKLKITRAKEHIDNIESMVGEFTRSHGITREMEAGGIYEAVKIKIGQIPIMLPIIVGEVAFHLRSCLDHLAGSLAVLNKKTATGVSFPFAGNRNEFERPKTQEKINKLSVPAQKLIRRFKPYKGGNNLLWALNRLRNSDTHVGLVPFALSGPSWGGKKARIKIAPQISDEWISPMDGPIVIEYPHTFEKEIVLARCRPGAEIEYDLEPEITIAISDIEFLEGKGVVTRLRELVDLTERIVAIIECRFF